MSLFLYTLQAQVFTRMCPIFTLPTLSLSLSLSLTHTCTHAQRQGSTKSVDMAKDAKEIAQKTVLRVLGGLAVSLAAAYCAPHSPILNRDLTLHPPPPSLLNLYIYGCNYRK